MPEALIEEATWKTEEIRNVAEGLIHIYKQTLPVVALPEWEAFENAVAASIKGGMDIQEIALRKSSFLLTFRGPRSAYIPIITEEGVTWMHREPRFVLFKTFNAAAPNFDGMLSEANRRITEASLNRFDLMVVTDPLRLIFPKRRFAHTRLVKGHVRLED